MTPAETRILRSFWHKGRKTFVPLTFTDIVLRSKVEYGVARTAAKLLSNEGMISVHRAERLSSSKIYELTPEAQRIALEGMMG